MDKAQLDEFRQLLEAERKKVTSMLEKVADPDVDDHVPGDYAAKFPNYGDDNYLDPGSDSPDEVQGYQENLALTGQLERHLKQIDAALQRMEDGTYGKDVNTGEEISLDRLRANPAAETAISKQDS